ncbi:MAG: selenide, water dikinase SelD [Bacteroidales bacterium]|nr:selenide, water dikinase SelD [Bacteroidales bacterium]
MESIRLTQFSPGAGCGCKISPAQLRQILQESLPGSPKKEQENLPAAAQTQGPGTREQHAGSGKKLAGAGEQRANVAGLDKGAGNQRTAVVDRSNVAIEFPQLLVGYESSDDAAVYDIGGGKAVISTTDFFTPIVDDPYDFGRIAATNAISDIYAMGGTPLMAISILGWPLEKLPAAVAGKAIEGARTICSQAGIPLAGGHSISISEPVFGLAVTGIIDKELVRRNNSVQKGDYLFLTKPLGIGLISTGIKRGIALPEHMEMALRLMTRLNAEGPWLALLPGVHALTDVTGFGLLGHCLEMVDGSGLTARIRVNDVPLILGIDKYIALDCIPGGTYRNYDSYGHRLAFSAADNTVIVGVPEGGIPKGGTLGGGTPGGGTLPDPVKLRLCDPQTSGGLLIAAHPDSRDVLEKEFGAVCIGEVN